MAKDTQQDMEWDASVLPDAGHRWAGVLHAAASDVEHWLHERSTQAPHGAGVDKV
ncbi:hypothetical protein PF005_g27607 [Phytophthora fragariae]|uniref:Uncharacterized protein n=1 Tax=Phytophthora fragariae TaxID=53985 RepID=A0A6A3VR12_9STRA|nr:hypothetical protein PF009_g28229 [Phytophthora fragariae]KAE8969887.1 hypothetical protein PF011_g26630 [Phytophthora fragariae]KAE9068067.1 hypothetical protein PF010_g27214 [Phytophthora fragariae]KAE9068758.1 hypothetical protein PF007_g27563 [Phytophthora fragariae]KAE9081223.1 hypothetical protein PF006_g27159 [Phytophthora fragariae]